VNVTDFVAFTGELVAPATMTLAGSLLSATGSTVSALSHLLAVSRSTLTSTGLDALIALTGTTGTFGGIDPFNEAAVSGRLVNITASGAAPAMVTLDGPLLHATGSNLTMTGALGVFNGAQLIGAGGDPLMTFSGGSVTATSNFVSISTSPRQADAGAAPLEPAPSVTLAGPLLAVTNNAALTTGRRPSRSSSSETARRSSDRPASATSMRRRSSPSTRAASTPARASSRCDDRESTPAT
jgi:hypothetical protein